MFILNYSLLGLAGDDCLPLPMHPLVVGYDHEWMSISPLSVPTWVCEFYIFMCIYLYFLGQIIV